MLGWRSCETRPTCTLYHQSVHFFRTAWKVRSRRFLTVAFSSLSIAAVVRRMSSPRDCYQLIFKTLRRGPSAQQRQQRKSDVTVSSIEAHRMQLGDLLLERKLNNGAANFKCKQTTSHNCNELWRVAQHLTRLSNSSLSSHLRNHISPVGQSIRLMVASTEQPGLTIKLSSFTLHRRSIITIIVLPLPLLSLPYDDY